MNYKSLFGVMVVLGLSVFVNAAQAALCTAPTSGASTNAVTGNFDTDDVTFRGSDSDACAGLYDGNDSQGTTGTTGLSNVFGGTWYSLAKDDDPGPGTAGPNTGSLPAIFGLNANFTVNANGGENGGFTLSWSGTDLPVQMDMAIVLKASDAWAGYLFEDELFNATTTSATGTWEIQYFNNGGNDTPDLSHFSLYVRDAATPPTTVPNGIPEPGTTALFGLGLLGFLAARRRLG